MRIVSLLPAATEWVCMFGGQEQLVGRSHECGYPEEIQDVPVVTAPTYEPDGDSAAIDEAVQEQLQEGLSLYEVDLERLRGLEPDLIVTQDQCEVCAVSLPELEKRLADWAGGAPEVVSMRPQTLKEVLDEALRLARAMDALDRAMEVIANLETGLRVLRDQIGVDRTTNPQSLPSVACVEWLEPLMVAGHWMPDVVEMAGGRAVLGRAGEPTQPMEWADLRDADPDVLALMPCGFTIEETRRDLHYLTEQPGWDELSAVQTQQVVLLDGNAYFNRPGPRLYRAIEVLASVLHSERVHPDPPVADWERQRLPATESAPA
ncbi:MAG: cobalamin-binding protein [Bacteroidetes bacterium QS_3_64_15]|nr:MAG: cobalamin-binding protein [Bacteroidetes bacterium QS_3_64_15]